jgi:hypothetical protein
LHGRDSPKFLRWTLPCLYKPLESPVLKTDRSFRCPHKSRCRSRPTP